MVVYIILTQQHLFIKKEASEMGFLVGVGAICTCSFGMAPCPLTVNRQMSIQGSGLPVATIFDNTPANLTTFGMCTSLSNPVVSAATTAALGVLTPQPCTPALTAPWSMGSTTVLFENKPALLHSSKLNCMWGGVIQIVQPGQQTVQAAE